MSSGDSLHLYVLGCGTPRPSTRRWGTGFCISPKDGPAVVVDCGPGTVAQLVKFGVSIQSVRQLAITHFHFDHSADYGTLLVSRWNELTDDHRPLDVIAPSPVNEITELLIGPSGVFSSDYNARLRHPLSRQSYRDRGGVEPRPPPLVDVTQLFLNDGRASFDRGFVRMDVIRVNHVQPDLDSLAFRLEFAECTVVFSGDCSVTPEFKEFCLGADVLVCNASEPFSAPNESSPWRMTGREAVLLAEESNASMLVLSHLGLKYDDESAAHEQIESARAKCEVILATGTMAIEL